MKGYNRVAWMTNCIILLFCCAETYIWWVLMQQLCLRRIQTATTPLFQETSGELTCQSSFQIDTFLRCTASYKSIIFQVETHREVTLLRTYTELEPSALKNQRYIETERSCFSKQRHMINTHSYLIKVRFSYFPISTTIPGLLILFIRFLTNELSPNNLL